MAVRFTAARCRARPFPGLPLLTDYVSPPLLCGIILIGALALFISDKVRHDLIALSALFACLATGLVKFGDALKGFADPAVVTVAAVLVVGRALELTGVAGWVARSVIPEKAGFTARLTMLLIGGCFLSAFMNHIAALVIMMPLATELARQSKKQVGTVLMPLSFATMIGGMTTLIATPPNMILSSFREKALGAPFGFFTMTPVGLAVCAVGLTYLILLGWRLLPHRKGNEMTADSPWRVLELPLDARKVLVREDISRQLRQTRTRILGLLRRNQTIKWPKNNRVQSGDRLLLISRSLPAEIRETIDFLRGKETAEPGHVTARLMVPHNSPLIGETHDAVKSHSSGGLEVVAAGPRAATLRCALSVVPIQSGDQLFVSGPPEDIARFAANERLIELDRRDSIPVNLRTAIQTVAIFAAAILLVIFTDVPPSLSFLGAAALIAALRLIPKEEVYNSIDWSILVLLAAMIPVGGSFETSGAADFIAKSVGGVMTGFPLPLAIAAMCALTLCLTILLNNVATAVIMGPLAIQLAQLLHVQPDAMLLAVLVGTSCDFLTPIGHQNNLLIMGPGGYRFSDYSRVGALMSLLVIATTAVVLSLQYG
ncbi:SLC13 family permease [Asticcacaulis taihuensis]|uniref:Citrate transporter n=1 Tax=Asticcacaulis taihuensis TaxID=260084 RepID=A0A1G4TVJ5_9CAUL|nr:Citrate transporter [Asticcacaulis taihuensis]